MYHKLKYNMELRLMKKERCKTCVSKHVKMTLVDPGVTKKKPST